MSKAQTVLYRLQLELYMYMYMYTLPSPAGVYSIYTVYRWLYSCFRWDSSIPQMEMMFYLNCIVILVMIPAEYVLYRHLTPSIMSGPGPASAPKAPNLYNNKRVRHTTNRARGVDEYVMAVTAQG